MSEAQSQVGDWLKLNTDATIQDIFACFGAVVRKGMGWKGHGGGCVWLPAGWHVRPVVAETLALRAGRKLAGASRCDRSSGSCGMPQLTVLMQLVLCDSLE
ncbi:Uncharacterized protein Fot_04930 [Forsythia ovata]|uniref:Uncharacterized protein n=1 Tax=Forsythia ovata TaxID=205694 RepID=A0ABD1WNP8_9LAMI